MALHNRIVEDKPPPSYRLWRKRIPKGRASAARGKKDLSRREVFKKEVEAIAKAHGGVLPTAEKLIAMGRRDIVNAIQYRYGGLTAVREHYGLGGERRHHAGLRD